MKQREGRVQSPLAMERYVELPVLEGAESHWLVPAVCAQHEGGEGAEECAAPLCCCETGYA